MNRRTVPRKRGKSHHHVHVCARSTTSLISEEIVTMEKLCTKHANVGETFSTLASTTLSQLAFLGESDPNFEWGRKEKCLGQWILQKQYQIRQRVSVVVPETKDVEDDLWWCVYFEVVDTDPTELIQGWRVKKARRGKAIHLLCARLIIM